MPKPMVMDVRLHLAQQQQAAGAWLAAAATYAQLAADHPFDHRLLANQANALWLADLPDAARERYVRALKISPDCPVSKRGLASCLRDLNQFETALAVHQELEAVLQPGSPDRLANLWAHSQVLVGLERFTEAFQRMALRRAWAEGLLHPPGNPLAPQLTLVSEQGFGDTLQFVRFLEPLLAQRLLAGLRGGLQLLVEPCMVDLLREGLAWLEDPPEVHPKPLQLPADALSLLDLPHALGPQPVAPRRADAAYLVSPLWAQERGRPPLAASSAGCMGPGPWRLGLVTAAGRPLDDPFCVRESHKRTLPEQIIWRLVRELRQRGAVLYDLQFGEESLRHRGLGLDLLDPGLSLDGFGATARVVAQLDLVVTVDTAMAHLVGAMGRPCWVLLPWSADPRWLREGSCSPWYPNSRLFRQPRSGDWHGAVDQLLECFSSTCVVPAKAP
jgi:hypothetical protein